MPASSQTSRSSTSTARRRSTCTRPRSAPANPSSTWTVPDSFVSTRLAHLSAQRPSTARMSRCSPRTAHGPSRLASRPRSSSWRPSGRAAVAAVAGRWQRRSSARAAAAAVAGPGSGACSRPLTLLPRWRSPSGRAVHPVPLVPLVRLVETAASAGQPPSGHSSRPPVGAAGRVARSPRRRPVAVAVQESAVQAAPGPPLAGRVGCPPRPRTVLVAKASPDLRLSQRPATPSTAAAAGLVSQRPRWPRASAAARSAAAAAAVPEGHTHLPQRSLPVALAANLGATRPAAEEP